MFLDRRSLLQSAAALLVPSTAATLPMGNKSNPHLERALERYLEAFAAFYGKPFAPDDDSCDAHHRADEDLEKRQEAFQAATDELTRLVLARHGMDAEKECTGLAALSVDVGEFTVAVGPKIEPDLESGPFGLDGVVLIPRTSGARARLDAIPAYNPREFASEEEEERLGLESPAYPPEFDLSRMPANEPIPTRVQIHGPYNERGNTASPGEPGHVMIYRHWEPKDAWACQRCELCPFAGELLEDLGRDPSCSISVKTEDVDRVLHGATPPETDRQYPNDLMVDTAWEWTEGGVLPTPARLEVLVMSRTAWEADPRSKNDEWAIAEGRRGTRGKLVVVSRKLTGPQPRILMA